METYSTYLANGHLSREKFRSEAEILQEKIESLPITDLDSARFADHLAPEHEQSWQEIIELSTQTQGRIEDLMVPMWHDNSLPHTFRDRAMLVLVGTGGVEKSFGPEKRTTSFAFWTDYVSLRSLEKSQPYFSYSQFCEWVQDALRYQRETGLRIIHEENYLRWQFEFYERGLIAQKALEEFVTNIDITASSPTGEGSGWDGDWYDLDPDRFPLLSDILKSRTVSPKASKIRTWAIKHFEDWLKYQTDKNIDLPDWLKVIQPEFGRKLISELLGYGGEKPEWLSWDQLRPAIALYGYGIILNDFPRRFSSLDLGRLSRIDDQRIKEEMLTIVLEDRNTKAAAGKGYVPLAGSVWYSGNTGKKYVSDDLMKVIVEGSNNNARIKELFELELKHAAEHKAEFNRKLEEDSRKRREQEIASPEYQARQQAMAAFLAKISNLSQLKEQS